MDLYMLLALMSGLFWTITYVLIIKQGFIDKTFGMPLACLTLNISWELIYALIIPAPSPQCWINLVWFFFDVLIVVQLLMYWKTEYADIKPASFYSFFGLMLVMSFCILLFIQIDFSNAEFFNQRGHALGMGRAYTAFLMNLLISILFVVMIYKRKSTSGQSLYIGIAKMIGTIFADLPFIITPYVAGSTASTLHPGTPASSELVWPFLYTSILIFDIIYCILIYKQCKKEGKNPWALRGGVCANT